MKQNLTLEALRQLLERRDMCALRDALTQTHPADLAVLLDELDRPEMLAVFRALPKELAAEVFSDLPPEDQQALIQAATDQELSAIVEELWVDDAVDLLEELPAGVVKRVLQAARPDTRQLINQFLHYPENSVGSIMTAEFTDLKRDMTVAQAIAHIRRPGADSESIYTCYVTDAARRLEGVGTIRELLLAGDQALVADLMERDVIRRDRRGPGGGGGPADEVRFPLPAGGGQGGPAGGHRHGGRRHGRAGGGGHRGL